MGETELRQERVLDLFLVITIAEITLDKLWLVSSLNLLIETLCSSNSSYFMAVLHYIIVGVDKPSTESSDQGQLKLLHRPGSERVESLRE
ncbi:unnamed protein product [Vicia faba]|uniref:Uncharacterized protein n=1 Tax=Vicia faba TaxID=3906 RepID=A0AAV1AK31_VICFA|nr:unnamed protein product [Vicia faba]